MIDDLSNELEGYIEEGKTILQDAELKEKYDEFITESELMIRKHPLKSVAVGALVGYLFARIIK